MEFQVVHTTKTGLAKPLVQNHCILPGVGETIFASEIRLKRIMAEEFWFVIDSKIYSLDFHQFSHTSSVHII
jgi:hypothetical protein